MYLLEMEEYEESDAEKEGRYDAAVEVYVSQKNGARQVRPCVLYTS